VSGSAADRLVRRTAFEALRAGVPNRAAVRLLGSVEDAIEERFETGLGQVWNDAPAPGLLFAGGFGVGKSHLLGFLREVALQQNFVVSTVSVSKETPLSAPLAMFTAALRDTIVPGHADDAMAVALAELQRRPEAARELEQLVSLPSAGFAPVFAAMLHLLSRQLPADLLRRMEGFLAGGKLPGPSLRQALTQAGARGMFDLGRVTEATLAQHRERFVPLLFRAAGFSGWCVLIDEVELIGRYSPLQRARAYAELARWLGRGPGVGLGASPRPAGLYVAAAITDDFASAVINARQDDEKLPERLRLKGAEQQAELALAAIRAIEAAPLLHPPAEADLLRHAETLRRSYADAYGWNAPPLPLGERRANRTIRHHVRGWITQWDVLRLQGRAPELELGAVAPNYAETADLAEPLPAMEEDP
jgi:hypothetical protein